MGEYQIKWGVDIAKMDFPNQWNIGFAITHWGGETYLYISLLSYQISIGKIAKEVTK